MKTKSRFHEVLSYYEDDTGVLHFDAYRTWNSEEQGKTVAWLFNGKPYCADAEDQFDPMLREAIHETLTQTK